MELLGILVGAVSSEANATDRTVARACLKSFSVVAVCCGPLVMMDQHHVRGIVASDSDVNFKVKELMRPFGLVLASVPLKPTSFCTP